MIIDMQHILDAQVPDAARCLGWTTVTNCDMTRREIPTPGGSWGMEETVVKRWETMGCLLLGGELPTASKVGYNPSDLHGISRVNPLIIGVN